MPCRCRGSGGSRASTSIRCATVPSSCTPRGRCCSTTPGKAILELVDGRRTVGEIAGILGERYQTDVTADVSEYLAHLAERELIRDA